MYCGLGRRKIGWVKWSDGQSERCCRNGVGRWTGRTIIVEQRGRRQFFYPEEDEQNAAALSNNFYDINSIILTMHETAENTEEAVNLPENVEHENSEMNESEIDSDSTIYNTAENASDSENNKYYELPMLPTGTL